MSEPGRTIDAGAASTTVMRDVSPVITVEAVGWQIRPVEEGPGLTLTGEFDLLSRRQVQSALARLVDQGGDLRLDMAGVTFADLGTVTSLALAAQSLRPGRRMILHRPPHQVRRVLDLCWPALDRIEVTR